MRFVDVACDEAAAACDRIRCLEQLKTRNDLAEDDLDRLHALLPGGDDAITLTLIGLLGRKGNAAALNDLVRYSTRYKSGKLTAAIISAIEMLERRLQVDVSDQLPPAIRRSIKALRE